MISNPDLGVFVGIDTHAQFHHVAVIDRLGRELGDLRVPATPAGFAQTIRFAEAAGEVVRAAVEGTNSYGAGLTRALLERGWPVVETSPGDKADRRRRGKTDAADAFTAARAAASGRAAAIPKDSTGLVEAIRVLHVTRRLAVQQQTQLMNQLKGMLVTAPAELRERFPPTTRLRLARAIGGTRILPTGPVQEAVLTALKLDARRWLGLREIERDLTRQIRTLVEQTNPALTALPGVGPDTAAALLIATGQNATRIRSEAALAHLFGIAPVPASSGQHDRNRLDRGGNRQGNAAVHRIALVRMRHDPTTQDYIGRCLTRGKTKKEAIRLLKRHLIRELYPALTTT